MNKLTNSWINKKIKSNKLIELINEKAFGFDKILLKSYDVDKLNNTLRYLNPTFSTAVSWSFVKLYSPV